MSKEVLVLGGTGAMGTYLVPRLASASGTHCSVTTRQGRGRPGKESGRENALGDEVTYLRGNAHDLTFTSNILRKQRFDAIIDFMNYSTPEMRERVDLLLSHTDHYLFLSSARVFAESASPIHEESPRLLDVCSDARYLATDEYALSKARQENMLRDSHRRNWTILRPYITYSSRRFQLGTLEADQVVFRAWRGLPVALPREVLSRKTTMTWANDVASMIAALVSNPSSLGESFNLATSESRTWREVAGLYANSLGLVCQETELDAFLAATGSTEQVRRDRLFDRVFNSDKIEAATGIGPGVPLEEGLVFELASVKVPVPGQWPVIAWHRQGAMDRLTKRVAPPPINAGASAHAMYWGGRSLILTDLGRSLLRHRAKARSRVG
ncbi:MAG: NAD-dependent epimerase/dehydratase family protein [Bifidobacteriaceae bacterium]|jgi:nucleoside-diphosphate-sugar epimerase|nr:NAD-dependent epimerase/dehydratase family protein [Bifidobacteriaceae bacterium]